MRLTRVCIYGTGVALRRLHRASRDKCHLFPPYITHPARDGSRLTRLQLTLAWELNDDKTTVLRRG